MMYSEFVTGTGCKENEHNYNVFKELEIIYMNTNCSKEHIYEMGKKLVDNSKSPERIELEEKIKAEIAEIKDEIEALKKNAESFRYAWKTETDPIWIKDDIALLKARIKELKWVLA